MQEKIVKTQGELSQAWDKRECPGVKVCKQCNLNFDITDKDLEFYDKISPKFNGEKFQIPTPSLCPDCRQQRRLTFRNEKSLYRRKCDATWKDIISIYSSDKKFKIYNQKYWWSDKWDAMDYGREFDFNRWFFEQFSELLKDVPDYPLFQVNLENSNYCNILANSKNCYLVFASSKLENCMYWVSIERCKSVLDCIMVKDSQNCYESFMLNNCFNLFYSKKCNNCSNSYFLNECDNCNNCLFCSDIKNKDYYIWNKKVTKNEFEIKKKEILNLDRKEFELLKIKFYEWFNKIPKCFANIVNWVSVSWDNIVNCTNLENGFDCFEVEKCKNLIFCIFWVSNCYDCNYSWHNIDFCYKIKGPPFFSHHDVNNRERRYNSNYY